MNILVTNDRYQSFAAVHARVKCCPASSQWSAVQGLGRAQSWRFTPRSFSFFAYESLRLAAFAAVSMAA